MLSAIAASILPDLRWSFSILSAGTELAIPLVETEDQRSTAPVSFRAESHLKTNAD